MDEQENTLAAGLHKLNSVTGVLKYCKGDPNSKKPQKRAGCQRWYVINTEFVMPGTPGRLVCPKCNIGALPDTTWWKYL